MSGDGGLGQDDGEAAGSWMEPRELADGLDMGSYGKRGIKGNS